MGDMVVFGAKVGALVSFPSCKGALVGDGFGVSVSLTGGMKVALGAMVGVSVGAIDSVAFVSVVLSPTGGGGTGGKSVVLSPTGGGGSGGRVSAN